MTGKPLISRFSLAAAGSCLVLAKAELERSKARQESQNQLRRMEDEAPAS